MPTRVGETDTTDRQMFAAWSRICPTPTVRFDEDGGEVLDALTRRRYSPLPPGYPRSDPSEVRSRYFDASAACTPIGGGSLFQDDLDNLELAWTFAMTCTPPTPAVSTTWGRVRSLSR